MWPFKKTNKQKLIEEIKKENLDLGSVFNNINNRQKSESLYKELCSTIHPDRFVSDPDKGKVADGLFKRVQASRTDYDALLNLKEEIDTLIVKES